MKGDESGVQCLSIKEETETCECCKGCGENYNNAFCYPCNGTGEVLTEYGLEQKTIRENNGESICSD